MTAKEMDDLLRSILPRESVPLDPLSDQDWNDLVQRFGCNFNDDFRRFIELMAVYQFPGDILNVSRGRTNGNDLISVVYDHELRQPSWKREMIPFYSIGNGDYFCLSATLCPESPVYYYYHEREAFDEYLPSFEAWVKDLPDFLS